MTARIVTYDEIKPANACRHDGVALGEVMLRFDPFDVPTALAREIRIFQGGGETNVACGLAYTFGLRAAVLTALVDDHIGANIRNQLRTAGVDTSKIIWFNTRNDGGRFSTDQKGTLMNGVNFTYVGKGVIASDTLYYRAHTAARELREGDIDWDALFGAEGVRIFSTGGIYTLISPTSAGLAIEGVKKANEHGTFVAADLNYRSKVEPNKARAREINQTIAPYLGFLVGNDSDLSDALGYETKVSSKAPFDEWLEAYKGYRAAGGARLPQPEPDRDAVARGDQRRHHRLGRRALRHRGRHLLHRAAARQYPHRRPHRRRRFVHVGRAGRAAQRQRPADRGPVGRGARHPGAGNAGRYHDGGREGRAGRGQTRPGRRRCEGVEVGVGRLGNK